MLDREGFVSGGLYGGQVDLQARREGYLYDESLRQPSEAAGVLDEEQEQGAAEAAGALLVAQDQPAGELLEPTVRTRTRTPPITLATPSTLTLNPTHQDDFDVLVLQFQKAERQEEESGSEAALAGVPRASGQTFDDASE